MAEKRRQEMAKALRKAVRPQILNYHMPLLLQLEL
jgi:hypothetical protein